MRHASELRSHGDVLIGVLREHRDCAECDREAEQIEAGEPKYVRWPLGIGLLEAECRKVFG